MYNVTLDDLVTYLQSLFGSAHKKQQKELFFVVGLSMTRSCDSKKDGPWTGAKAPHHSYPSLMDLTTNFKNISILERILYANKYQK